MTNKMVCAHRFCIDSIAMAILSLFVPSLAFSGVVTITGTADTEVRRTLVGSHPNAVTTHTSVTGARVSPSTFWFQDITIAEKDEFNDKVTVDGTIQHLKSPMGHDDGAGGPITIDLGVDADNATGSPLRVSDADRKVKGHGFHSDLYRGSLNAKVSTFLGADTIDNFNFTIDVEHKGKPGIILVGNGTDNAPRTGTTNPSQISFDSGTGSLSFTDTTIDFANLVGDDSLDPVFSLDPLRGATISTSSFTLDGPSGNGFLFSGGSMTISKGSHTFLSADIPMLLIDDDSLGLFGLNVFGLLTLTEFDSGGSLFMDEYFDFFFDNSFLTELFGRTQDPVTSLIATNQSFTTSLYDQSVGFSTPEPSIIALWFTGILGMLLFHRKKIA